MSETSSEILVKDLMSKALISVEPTTTVFQIASMMSEGGIGSVFVKKDGNPAGIVTDRDFAIKIATQKLPLETTAEKIASYPLETIDLNESITKAATQMSEKRIRKLGVTENGKVVGIITSTDLVNQLTK